MTSVPVYVKVWGSKQFSLKTPCRRPHLNLTNYTLKKKEEPKWCLFLKKNLLGRSSLGETKY